jgi:outer membrane protein
MVAPIGNVFSLINPLSHNGMATHVTNRMMNIVKQVTRMTAVLLLALSVGAVQESAAQQPAIGYTNQELLLRNMPEMQQVQQQIEQEAQSMREEMQAQEQELQEMYAEYQKQQALLSDQRRAEREQAIRQKQQQLQQAAQERQQQLAQREAELMQPLLEKLQTALNGVAQEQDLNVVLRSQALLYVNEQNVVDVTPQVAQRLGIDVTSGAEAGPSVDAVSTAADTSGVSNQ